VDPLRPSDHAQSQAPAQPVLGAGGWARFLWRQLTSMRTALFLLLLLALAAIPGSLVPQRSSDPNGVLRYQQDDPELYSILDSLQLFDTYTSVWFSAIYLLLFISLVGCILPRTNHHLKALRTPPPQTPANLSRLEAHRIIEITNGLSESEVIERAHKTLTDAGYRVRQYGPSLAGERGYLRETANLIFHFALVGILVAIAAGTGFKYSGQRILVEGQTFTNDLASYDTFTQGAWFREAALNPYALTLNTFTPTYQFNTASGRAEPLDFEAVMAVATDQGSDVRSLRVNEPLHVLGNSVYLLGNGFAPVITVKNPAGEVVFTQPVVFLPQDQNLTSVGVVKVPDGLEEQLGLMGFFYPSAVTLESGALASVYPEPDLPIVTFNAFVGDLGLDQGIPRNVYSLNTDDMTQLAGGDAVMSAIVLGLGQEQQLPGGLGSVSFEALPRYISVDIHRDPTQIPVAIFSLLVVLGLVTSLFVVRRRVWVKCGVEGGVVAQVELAALSRNDDPGQEAAIDHIAQGILLGEENRVKA
jgi:cytochrome c biogenesis protein